MTSQHKIHVPDADFRKRYRISRRLTREESERVLYAHQDHPVGLTGKAGEWVFSDPRPNSEGPSILIEQIASDRVRVVWYQGELSNALMGGVMGCHVVGGEEWQALPVVSFEPEKTADAPNPV